MKRTLAFIVMCISLFPSPSEAWRGEYNYEAKLENARRLIFDYNRPLPAEAIIDDVIERCEKKNNELCLTAAYYAYGQFLTSYAVKEWYKKSKFFDKTVTYDNKHQKSLEYLNRALILAEKHNLYAMASAIYVRIAITEFTYFDNRESACVNFDRSLECHLMFKKDNPDVKVNLPDGFESFEEYILQAKEEAGCL